MNEKDQVDVRAKEQITELIALIDEELN